MDIQHRFYDGKGAWFVEQDGETLAELTYHVKRDGTTLSLDGTTVDDRLRGQGAGKQLVQAAVDHARATNVKVLPVCPFVVAMFEKMPEYADVVSV